MEPYKLIITRDGPHIVGVKVFDVLITGSVLYTGRELIKDAYVYVKNGRVIDYGVSPVPEDYTYATLVLGGEGRIIVPGLTMIIDAPAYPLRIYRPSLKDRSGMYNLLSPSEAMTLSLPAIYEAHISGATTVLVEYKSLDIVAGLETGIGGFYGLAYPACLGEPPRHEAIPIVTVHGEGCDGEGIVEVRGDWGFIGDDRVLALFHRPTYSRLEGDPLEESARLRKAIGLGDPQVKRNERAEIAVFNSSRPPGVFLDRAGEDVIRRIYSTGARIESLMAGESILVDQGEHLYIVEKQFSEARRIGLRFLRRR